MFIWLYGSCHPLPLIKLFKKKICCVFLKTYFLYYFNFKLVVVVSAAPFDGTVNAIVASCC